MKLMHIFHPSHLCGPGVENRTCHRFTVLTAFKNFQDVECTIVTTKTTPNTVDIHVFVYTCRVWPNEKHWLASGLELGTVP